MKYSAYKFWASVASMILIQKFHRTTILLTFEIFHEDIFFEMYYFNPQLVVRFSFNTNMTI
jgi:hypothetical protein